MAHPSALALPLHAETHGGEGPPLLLVHGFGTNSFTWRHWVGDLAQDHRVLTVDLKGFGAAPKPRDDRYSPLDQADLLYRLILQQDLQGLTMVGHSLGGGIVLLTALQLVARAPERLRALVLVDGAAYPQPLSPWIARAGRPILGPALLRLLPSRLIIRTALRLACYDPKSLTRSQVEAYAESLRTADGRYALTRTARQLLAPGVEAAVERLGEITVPALLLWGEGDSIVPLGVGERLARTLPRSTLEVLPECGHMPQEEKPRESLRHLRHFLQSLDAAVEPS